MERVRPITGAVREAVRHAFHAGRGRRHVDDGAAAPAGQHAGQERADGAVHGLGVQVEGEVPVFLAALEDGARVHDAGAIEQAIERAVLGLELLRECGHGCGVEDVQPGRVQRDGGRQRGGIGGQLGQAGLVHVGGPHLGALARQHQGRRPADAVGGGGDQDAFAQRTLTHVRVLCGWRRSAAFPCIFT
jgi:hypothetical protein